ncbi:MAG TPA: outer membrane protein assembly factor BamE [Devosiaceae bacterium]|nr:outer membrane protein assembly factor BamE [Devosiaceae bacterium]
MSLSATARRFAPLALGLALITGLSACDTGLGSLSSDRVQGYDLSPDGLAQIRPGQSQALVTTVLGSPQFTNDFGGESAYYYVSTHVNQTAFGWTTIKDRTVLAIYFDKNKKVKDRAIYSLKDGRVFEVEQRKTPSYGSDKTFIQSIVSSFNGTDPTSASPKIGNN